VFFARQIQANRKRAENSGYDQDNKRNVVTHTTMVAMVHPWWTGFSQVFQAPNTMCTMCTIVLMQWHIL